MTETKFTYLEQLTGLRYSEAIMVFLSYLSWDNNHPVLKTIEKNFINSYIQFIK
jgi:hypothetical protein